MENPTASAGFEPANLGTKGQHASSRPSNPLTNDLTIGPGTIKAILHWKETGVPVEPNRTKRKWNQIGNVSDALRTSERRGVP